MIERDQSRAWTRARGFRHSSPYYDRDVVDLALRMHPEKLMEGGYSKAPLRKLVRELLPEVPMVKRKVDFTSSADRLLRGPGQQIWREFGGPRILSDRLGILDRGSVDAFMEAYFRGEQHAAYGAWLLLSTERWLRALAAQGRV
jgi:asparagine synthetase B (glutamine-hydrolysing)